MTYTLTTQIKSGKGKILAEKGDTVKLIAWHDNVAIIEANGERFSVSKDSIKLS